MDNIEFGHYLKDLRKQQKLTLKQVAKDASISDTYLSQIENAKKDNFPSSEILIRLAKPLGVHYSVILNHAGYVDFDSNDLEQNQNTLKELELAQHSISRLHGRVNEINEELNYIFSFWIDYIVDENKKISEYYLEEYIEGFKFLNIDYKDEYQYPFLCWEKLKEQNKLSDLVGFIDEIIFPISYGATEITASLKFLGQLTRSFDLNTLLDAPAAMYQGKIINPSQKKMIKSILESVIT